MSRSAPSSRLIPLLSLWFGVLGGPLAWGAHLLLSYAFVQVACALRSPWPLHLVTVATGFAALAAGVVAWRNHRDTSAHQSTTSDRRSGLAGFLGLFGMVSSALFFGVILAQGMLPLLLNPCP